MNNERDKPPIHPDGSGIAGSPGRVVLATVLFLAPLLLMSACTDYRPLDQGSTVPWAQALSASKGGPIGDNRYRVSKGDALGLIADRYGLRLAALAAANNIEPPYILYPGEVLRIPVNAPLPTERPAPPRPSSITATTLPPSSPSQRPESKPGPAVTEEGKRYIVGEGESLSVIAARHGLRLGELVVANGIEPPYQIRPGQSLIIPLTEAERRQRASADRSQPARQETITLTPPPPLSAEGFLWPVNGPVVSSFEQNSAKGRSGGITIAAQKGTPVRAADNGIVAYAGEALRGYGQMVMLRHAEGYVTLYAHNDALLVREGDVVRRGQPIAEVGDSGDVGDSQLHFELRKGTKPIDPTKVLAGVPGRQVGKL